MSDDARDARIRALLPVVRRLARRVRRMIPGADLDDLVGDGHVGLLRAVDAYDASRGVPLERYARRIIVGAMLNGIRRLDPVSERVRRTMRQAETLRSTLAHDLGRFPSAAELEARLPELPRARTEAHRGTPLSLDAPFPPGERLAPDRTGDPQELVVRAAERARLGDALAALGPRRRAIVVEHYYRDRSLRALGRPLGISPQRVSQLHAAALQRLREALAPGR